MKTTRERRRRRWLCAASLTCAVSLFAGASLAAEPRPPPRPPPRPEGPDTTLKGRDGKARVDGAEPERRERRDLEGGTSGVRSMSELTTDEPMLEIEWRAGGCGIDEHHKFVAALLSLENRSDLMSLEIWGDSHEYVPYQRVYYYMRVPRAAYITMFWIGPKQDVFVPFQNLRIPADRDVRVDPDSIVVPPLGREQWVAVATLEPVPLECWTTDLMHVAWVEKVKQLPHGVGRWEVRSKTSR